jgi:hypothetical protein
METLEFLNFHHRPTLANASDAVFPSETLEALTIGLFELSIYHFSVWP